MGTDGLKLRPQILNRSKVYFGPETQSNIYCEQQAGCDSPLDLWASFYYKYLCTRVLI